MDYLAYILYLLGVYMHYHLGSNITRLNGEYYGTKYMVVASFFWPFSAVYYLVKNIK